MEDYDIHVEGVPPLSPLTDGARVDALVSSITGVLLASVGEEPGACYQLTVTGAGEPHKVTFYDFVEAMRAFESLRRRSAFYGYKVTCPN